MGSACFSYNESEIPLTFATLLQVQNFYVVIIHWATTATKFQSSETSETNLISKEILMNDRTKEIRDAEQPESADANRDPISGTPGAHPVGTGVGAAAGGVAAGLATATLAGAVTGSVVGPVGTVIGATVGAIVGGLAGKAVAESVNPTREDLYWRSNYSDRPYIDRTKNYEDYGPAYGFAVNRYSENADRRFEDVETDLSRDWPSSRGQSTLEWSDARPAARDAWERLRDPNHAPRLPEK